MAKTKTVIDSDKIYVIDKGSIVEEGSHFELLSNKQNYYKLINNTFEKTEFA